MGTAPLYRFYAENSRTEFPFFVLPIRILEEAGASFMTRVVPS
jgi:hypothetical protein